jgi:hypothetical protein
MLVIRGVESSVFGRVHRVAFTGSNGSVRKMP